MPRRERQNNIKGVDELAFKKGVEHLNTTLSPFPPMNNLGIFVAM